MQHDVGDLRSRLGVDAVKFSRGADEPGGAAAIDGLRGAGGGFA